MLRRKPVKRSSPVLKAAPKIRKKLGIKPRPTIVKWSEGGMVFHKSDGKVYLDTIAMHDHVAAKWDRKYQHGKIKVDAYHRGYDADLKKLEARLRKKYKMGG